MGLADKPGPTSVGFTENPKKYKKTTTPLSVYLNFRIGSFYAVPTELLKQLKLQPATVETIAESRHREKLRIVIQSLQILQNHGFKISFSL